MTKNELLDLLKSLIYYRLACMAGNGKSANVAHVENLSK